MRVKILSGSTTYWLAGNPSVQEREHSSCANLVFTPGRLDQQQDGLRWTHSAFRDRKNAFWQVSFSTRRLFASPYLAGQFVFTVENDQPITGTVIFRNDDGLGGYEEWALADAIISLPTVQQEGCTLHLNYSLRGPIFAPYQAYVVDESDNRLVDESGNDIISP